MPQKTLSRATTRTFHIKNLRPKLKEQKEILCLFNCRNKKPGRIRQNVPIAYADSSDQTGWGYVIVHETSPELVVFSHEEIYQDVSIENVFYLGKEHAEFPAFTIRYGVQGIKPPSLNIWSHETCESFFDLIYTACLHFQPSIIINGETVMGNTISRRDGWSLRTWLVAAGKGTYDAGDIRIYPHMEGE